MKTSEWIFKHKLLASSAINNNHFIASSETDNTRWNSSSANFYILSKTMECRY